MEWLNDCPECGKQFTQAKRYCSCGWKIMNVKAPPIFDDQCGFWIGDRRCKKIGTIASHRTSDTWYCFHHWYETMSTKKGTR